MKLRILLLQANVWRRIASGRPSILLLAALAAFSLSAGDWETTVSGFPSMMIVPNVAALVTGAPATTAPQHVRLERGLFSNTSNATVTVQITDNSTNCNSAVCQPLPTIVLQANQVVSVYFGNVPLEGGVKWVASVQNVVHGWVTGSVN